MAGSSFGSLFRITSFGESHGKALGVVIDGCPAGLYLDEKFIQSELNRRRPGQSEVTTPRNEEDKFEIISGVFENKTTGAPVAVLVYNKDHKSADYDALKNIYRPSHADFTYDKKYGVRDYRGSGRASARETVSRVIAGAVAKLFLGNYNIKINAYVKSIGLIEIPIENYPVNFAETESNVVRCPDDITAKKMIAYIEQIKTEGDSTGGVISCTIHNVPSGLGEPVFDKLPADLAKAMMSINAVKGFEIGSGFSGSKMKGSQHNDALYVSGKDVKRKTNRSGGTEGGISNGEEIFFNVAFKPPSTISKTQNTVNTKGEEIILEAKGRHDPCVVPRAVVIVEAMAALVIADHMLRNRNIRL